MWGNGAGSGIRTHDLHIGNVTYYRCTIPAYGVSFVARRIPQLRLHISNNRSKSVLRFSIRVGASSQVLVFLFRPLCISRRLVLIRLSCVTFDIGVTYGNRTRVIGFADLRISHSAKATIKAGVERGFEPHTASHNRVPWPVR